MDSLFLPSLAPRLVLSTLFFTLSALAWKSWPSQQPIRSQLLLLFILALAVRALAWPIPPSDDVNRYLWEGKLIRAGNSPYAQTADDESLAALRDQWWEGMNHKDKETTYPPLAQLLFAAVGFLWYSPQAFKLAASLADLCCLPLLVSLSGPGRLRWVAFYALNPVPVISYTGEGHFDVFMVLFMIGAVWALESRKLGPLSFALLAIAIQFKIIALALCPALFSALSPGQRIPSIVVFWSVLAIPCLPFWHSLSGLLNGILAFSSATSGNASIHWLLEMITGSKSWSSIICGGAALAISLWVATKTWTLPRKSVVTMTALLLLMPTVTYWYVAWSLPFAAVAGCPAMWVLSITDVFYYAAWDHRTTHGWWSHPFWAWSLQWIPVYAGLLAGAIHRIFSDYSRRCRGI